MTDRTRVSMEMKKNGGKMNVDVTLDESSGIQC